MSNQKNNGSIIAIITMMFLYAMIGFVTNLSGSTCRCRHEERPGGGWF